MNQSELKTSLEAKMIEKNEALKSVDFSAIDTLSLLNHGGEIIIASGSSPAGDAQIVAKIAAGSCHFQGVQTAVSIEGRVAGKVRAMTNAQAIQFGAMLGAK